MLLSRIKAAGDTDKWLGDVLAHLDAGVTVRAALDAEAKYRRDRLIRQIWRHFYSHLRPTPASQQIAQGLSRYATTAWRLDCRALKCPHPIGTLKAMHWQVMATGQKNPQSRQVFEIITAEMQSPPLSTA
jgi:hypothetical protein